MLHQKPSLAKWQQTSVIAKTPALFIGVGERNALVQIPIMDKLSSLQRALLSFTFSGRNSITFIALVRCLRLLKICTCLLTVRKKQSPRVSAGRGNVNRIQLSAGFSFQYFWYFTFQKIIMFPAAGSHTKPEEKSSMYHGKGGSRPGG